MPGILHVHLLRARRTVALFALTMTALVTGCGDDQPSAPVPHVPVSTVSITPTPDYITVGTSVRLTAQVRAADGDDLDRPVAWSSDNVALATVSDDGVVTALAPGVVAIRATSEGRTGRFDARLFATAPQPAIQSLQPAEVVAGTDAPVTVRVLGVGFTDRSRIYWNGEERPTQYVSATELRTALLPADLATARMTSFVVRTGAPGGGDSDPMPFEVIEKQTPSPTITGLSPSQITAGWGMPFTLTITGTNFTSLTRVVWDGFARETHVVNSTTLHVQVTPDDVRTAREVLVRVETPAPGGGAAEVRFPVRAIPVDRIDVLSPYGNAWTWVNNALPLVAVPRSATGAELTDRQALWWSSSPTIATMVPTGNLSTSVYGVRRGASTIEVTVENVREQRTVSVYDAPPFDVVFSAGIGPDQYLGIWSPTFGAAPSRVPINLTAFDPSPSPTGQEIAFAGMPRGGSVFDANVDVYVVARDGVGLRRLTTDAAADLEPAWSPDGAQIAFTSMRGGNRNVWIINADGTNLRRLTDALPGAPNAGSGGSAGDPAWSPDGTHLVYGVTEAGKTSLWIMRADGTGKRPLTIAMTGSAYDPTWSANGQYIGFRREFGSPTQIALTFVAASDGTTVFPVLNTAPMSASPAFSPDGQWMLASNSPLGNAATLYAVPLQLAGGPRVVIPATLGGARNAQWMRRP